MRDAVEQPPHLASFQFGGGFVEDDEARALDQCTGDFHDLPLLDREARALLLDVKFHAPAGQHALRLAPRRAPTDPAEAARWVAR